MILSPSDDVYVMGDQVVNSHVLYVEGQERKTYLRFNVPDVGPIRNATLELSQMIDTGEGTLHFYAADDRPWTEQDLRAHEVPEILYPIGQYIGTVGLYHVVSVDVSSWIKTPGAYTIVVTLDGEGNNDISFGSREGRSGPRLIINNQVQATSTAARIGASAFPSSNSMIEVGGTVGRMVLEPTDDVFLEANRCVNREFLHVEGGRRVTYLRFDIPEGDPFEKVKLVLAQSRDAGVGTIHAFLGSHAEWSERNFNSSRVPKTEKELGSYTGVVVPSQIVEIDVSDLGTHVGPCTLILTLDGTGADDIGFSSKEGPRGPRLVLWHGQGSP
jgi:hypothetical protein